LKLYRRWEWASRSRLAGVGFKPSGAAAFGNDVVVNDRGKVIGKMAGRCQGDEGEQTVRGRIVNFSSAVRTGVVQMLQDKPGRNLFTDLAAAGV
jgi:hypothetical protein